MVGGGGEGGGSTRDESGRRDEDRGGKYHGYEKLRVATENGHKRIVGISVCSSIVCRKGTWGKKRGEKNTNKFLDSSITARNEKNPHAGGKKSTTDQKSRGPRDAKVLNKKRITKVPTKRKNIMDPVSGSERTKRSFFPKEVLNREKNQEGVLAPLGGGNKTTRAAQVTREQLQLGNGKRGGEHRPRGS